ncbi:MAG: NB-ARC domain-containing protein [Alphaproteobacteria bacterium]
MKYLIILIIWTFALEVYAVPAIGNFPPSNSHFVGRKSLLQSLEKTFHTNPIVALTGGPGFGKTQLAKKFAYLQRTNYHLMGWFHVDHTLFSQFQAWVEHLNQTLHPKEKIPIHVSFEVLLAKIKRFIQQKGWNTLWIFDDVKDLKEITPYLPHIEPIHILITTRHKAVPYPTLSIGPFERKESMLFAKDLLGKLEKTETLRKLVSYLADHPLAIATAASFLLVHPSVSADAYIASHDLQQEEKRAKVLVDNHECNVYTSLQIILESLAQEHPEACKALKFLSSLYHTKIPFAYLQDFLKLLGAKKSADHILSILYEQSLVEVQKNTNSERVRISMHELIHQLIYTQLSQTEKKELLEKAILILAETFKGRSDLVSQKIAATPEYLLHAKTLLKEAKKLNYHSALLLSLRIRMLDYLSGTLRDFEAAKELIADIQQDQKSLQNSPSQMDQALLEMNLGFFEAVYFVNYEKAIQHETKAISLLEKIPESYEETIRTCGNLIQSYLLRGEILKARPYLETGKQLLANSKSDVYNALFVFAWVFFLTDQGNYEEAMSVIERHKKLFSNIPEYPTMEMYVLLQKAGVLIKLEKTKLCKEILNNVEKKISAFFGKRESNIGANFLLLKVFNQLGEQETFQTSLAWLQQAIGIYERAFHGPRKHRMQAFAHFVLGKLYEQQGDTKKAIDAYLQSEDTYNAVLKEKAIDDVSMLYAALALLGLKLNDMTMAQIYLRLHIKLFGLNHPRTLEILGYADDNSIPVPIVSDGES